MAVEVGESFWVVVDHGVEIECLRVGEICVRHWNRDGGPVGGEPAAKGRGVGTRAEIVVAGFRVPFLTLEFVAVAARRGDWTLPSVGIEIAIVQDGSGCTGHYSRGPEMVGEVIVHGAGRVSLDDALAAEEDVLVADLARGGSLDERVAAHSVPVEFPVEFRDAPVSICLDHRNALY